MHKIAEVCIIAGSDSIGGAGLQADLRVAALLGCSASNVVTCITAQDLKGVHAIQHLSGEIVSKQLACALSRKPKTVKIGMLGNSEIALAIYDILKDTGIPIVLDPVLISTSNSKLADEGAIEVLLRKLLSISYLVTPNLFEAGTLSGSKVFDSESAKIAASRILELGAKNVLVKGIHVKKGKIMDLLISQEGTTTEFQNEVIGVNITHGSGCRLSSAIACYMSIGKSLRESIHLASDLLRNEIARMKILYSTDT
ncbi:bifunctional hydroxymethylpyrimidine kinase/phosphomethylpyrimidine kinase [Neorickettsia findlayensis]|uniref:hydroxymethylpyrimidine kinase n=1 Tax=Neorickettsia findlayensis TaxID=2686014 RepID=A0A6P1GAP3_9RICK|nr:bifunctional hydroxymethylpyrimidine kinase/phosphomethylpyrimidine kinase [Neorickettsia findlayensis]QHD65526.1 bifunctional hydroxymethylpyrimidine kinase/phosphomethylpyrimidine kinase [Neorickettsia findlayensis]